MSVVAFGKERPELASHTKLIIIIIPTITQHRIGSTFALNDGHEGNDFFDLFNDRGVGKII